MTIFPAGSKVQGTYFGEQFTGTVESRRCHTMRNDADVVYVNLDKPLTVLGATREMISMIVDYSGNGIFDEVFLKAN